MDEMGVVSGSRVCSCGQVSRGTEINCSGNSVMVVRVVVEMREATAVFVRWQ